ncbi:hypothetical protein HOY82DRAFT_610343 [Tuber indicum]|nr:hypothetical protein HOY82DRAFT_610343 [Tuber indicum]
MRGEGSPAGNGQLPERTFTPGIPSVCPSSHLTPSRFDSTKTRRRPPALCIVPGAQDDHPLNSLSSAVSLANALTESRYNPEDKGDKPPASFDIDGDTFDLFGPYLTPMDSPPPGVHIGVTGYNANGAEEGSQTVSQTDGTKNRFLQFDTIGFWLKSVGCIEESGNMKGGSARVATIGNSLWMIFAPQISNNEEELSAEKSATCQTADTPARPPMKFWDKLRE